MAMDLIYPLIVIACLVIVGHRLWKALERKKFELSRQSRTSKEYRAILSRAHGDWKKAEHLIKLEMKANKQLTREQAIKRISSRYESGTLHTSDLIMS